ncbi:MAG: hypothetical protein K2X48_20260 [Chitinophagaceae bacterium]|nr:hypothetical protein [Chitinophagaceae bacterium]
MFNNRNYDRTYNIGPIFIDGNEIPFVPNSNHGGSYGLNEDFTSSGKKFLKGLWGKTISVRTEGKSNFLLRTEPDSSGGFYIPMSIEMEANFLDTKQYSLSGSSSITWQPDPNNPSGKVYLFAVYEGPDSKDTDPSLSDSTVVKFEKELSDNGSYTLLPNELGNGFPIGSRMSFVLARGSYQTITNSNGTEVILQAVTYSTSNIIAVKQ